MAYSIFHPIVFDLEGGRSVVVNVQDMCAVHHGITPRCVLEGHEGGHGHEVAAWTARTCTWSSAGAPAKCKSTKHGGVMLTKRRAEKEA